MDKEGRLVGLDMGWILTLAFSTNGQPKHFFFKASMVRGFQIRDDVVCYYLLFLADFRFIYFGFSWR